MPQQSGREPSPPMMDLNPRTGNWRPISTVPRDGRDVWLMDPDCGAFVMRWDATMKNGLFPDVIGMWVAGPGEFTWNEADDAGPTWWKPVGH